MKENQEVDAILVAVNAEGEDILPTAKQRQPTLPCAGTTSLIKFKLFGRVCRPFTHFE